MSYRLSNIPVNRSREVDELLEPKSKILFFAEGIQTEIIYLRELKQHVKNKDNIQIEIFDRIQILSGESNQLKVVERAKEYLETCQDLGRKKRNMVNELIKDLEYGEYSLKEIQSTLAKLEEELEESIFNSEDKLVAQLESIKVSYDFEPAYDKICFILDRDHNSFKEFQYDRVLEICENEGFNLGISSPNFEFYLLLHFEKEFPNKSEKDIFENKNNLTEVMIRKTMRSKLDESYKKNKYNSKIFFDHFESFKENVKGFKEDNVALKKGIGTSVGILLEDLIE